MNENEYHKLIASGKMPAFYRTFDFPKNIDFAKKNTWLVNHIFYWFELTDYKKYIVLEPYET